MTTPTGHGLKSGVDEEALRQAMLRYQRAEPEAAEELVQRLSPMLFRFLAHPAWPRSFTEDLLQETWLRIHRARHTYRPEAPLLPWLYAIARHTRLDAQRRTSRRHRRELPLEEVGERAASPDAASVAQLDLPWLLAQLPESQREVIFMLKVSGMSLKDVAKATSSTVGAVKQKAHRAYEKLRGLLSGGLRAEGKRV